VVKDLEDQLNFDPQSKVRVIVQWKSAPDAAKEQKVLSRGSLVRKLQPKCMAKLKLAKGKGK
jgi:hypothetical protein